MKLNKIQVPKEIELRFGEKQSWSLYLDEEQEAKLADVLQNNLVAMTFDSSVNFYLGNNELGFSLDAISNARIYAIKEKHKSGIICLEVFLVRAQKLIRILESECFSQATLDWFISNKEALENYIGLPISVQRSPWDENKHDGQSKH